MQNFTKIAKISVLVIAVVALVVTLAGCDLLFGCKHEYSENVVAATCTDGGYTTRTCSKCGETIRDSEVAALGHSYSDNVVAPTCTEGGYTEHTCTRCNDNYRDGELDAIGHNYGSVVVDPICSAEGYTRHTCANCSDSYDDSFIPVTAHRFNGGDCIYCSFKQPTDAIVPDTSWYVEEGAVFTITTKEQLAGIAALVNEGNTLKGAMIYLDADIDLGYLPWTPIGNAEYAFAGTLAGNGHTISNLALSYTTSYVGLFGNVSGEITNFTIDNATVFVNGSNLYVGIVCGYSTNKISGIKVDGYVDAKDCTAVGGILGGGNGLITDCQSTTEVVGFDSVGGIAGRLNSSTNVFIDLVNNGKVSGGDYTGGLFGQLLGSKNVIYIDKSQNYGDVSGKGYVGGIVGLVEGKVTSVIQSVTSSAKVSGEYFVGGIAGRANNVAIVSCSNAGTQVSASSATLISDLYYAYLGGYVGYGYSVEDCDNSSDITYLARGSYVGGIAGYLVNGVNECANTGAISGHDYVGGIAGGVATADSATVIHLDNSGAISGKSYVGGIAGNWKYANPITFGESTNSAAINGTSFIGGIIGSFDYSSTAVLSAYNLTNTGDVTGTESHVGGLFGYIRGKDSSTVNNCTVKANISGLYLVGGLIGKADYVLLSDSTNEGSTVKATGFIIEGEETNVYLGGYVGLGYKVSDCTNTVDINYTSLGNYVGGIIGKAISVVVDCTNNADISSKGSKVGGVAGELYSSVFLTYQNLVNNGDVSGASIVGGVVGNIYENVSQSDGWVWSNKHNLYVTTTISKLSNTGAVSGADAIGGIVGNVSLNNSWYGRWDDCCAYWYSCDHHGHLKLNAFDWTNEGSISGKTNVGEAFGSFYSDAASTLDNYTVTGKITINNEELEGTYDVGSSTNLTLTNRVGPEVEEEIPETEETPVE